MKALIGVLATTVLAVQPLAAPAMSYRPSGHGMGGYASHMSHSRYGRIGYSRAYGGYRRMNYSMGYGGYRRMSYRMNDGGYGMRRSYERSFNRYGHGYEMTRPYRSYGGHGYYDAY